MIGIFLGVQSSGKTLSMTYFAKDYYNKGYDIYSNYNLKFPHKKLNNKILQDFVYGKVQFTKAIFCIDELYLMMDSRNFGKKSQKIFTYFLLQTSKRNVHLFGTAQFLNTVEKRFRDNINFICVCSRKILKDGVLYDAPINKRIYDNEDIYINLTIFDKNSDDFYFNNMDCKTFLLKASPIYDLYDTTQLLDLEED